MLKTFWVRFKGIFLTFCLLGWTVLGCVMALYFIYLKPSGIQRFLRAWSSKGLKICGIKLILTGKHNLPTVGSVLLFNHSSLLDILAIYASVGPCASGPIYFGGKKELFKIPVFGFVMRKMRMLPIQRNNIRKTQAVYKNAVSRLHAGDHFCLSPEGGRATTSQIKKFKSGPFVFALQAQAPLVPLVISGMSGILPKQNLFLNLTGPCTLKISILPAISTKSKTLDDRHELKDQIQKQFLSFHSK